MVVGFVVDYFGVWGGGGFGGGLGGWHFVRFVDDETMG